MTNTNLVPYLQTHFYQTLDVYQINGNYKKQLWQLLNQHYNQANQPHRHYHNFNHIRAMISYFEQYKSQLTHSNPVALAIYFHDIIYDATRADNEEKSAGLFAKVCKDIFDEKLVDSVIQLIMLTKSHKLTNIKDKNGKLFLDMDLSILGQSSEVYQVYKQAIRLEYAHVNNDDYQQGRKSVLNNFLQRPRLYFSDDFYHRYEKQARKNISNELNLLEQHR